MKKIGITLLLLHFLFHCNLNAQKEAVDKTQPLKDSISYAFGVSLGNTLKNNFVDDLDLEVVKQAMHDVMKKEEPKLEHLMAVSIMNNHLRASMEKVKDSNAAIGKAFLEANKSKDGVKTIPSGLQYKVLKEGKGIPPAISDQVKVHYEGRLISGKIFDSSYEKGEAVTLPLKGVIKGWTEALMLMPPGSHWEVYVPSELAYGPNKSGPIGPNETLIFKIELLEVINSEEGK